MRAKLFQLVILVILLIVLIFHFRFGYYQLPQSPATTPGPTQVPTTTELFIISTHFREDDYLNKISSKRINTLFSILQEKEATYKKIFNEFNFFSFTDMVAKTQNRTETTQYQSEVQAFLEIKHDKVVATDDFIRYLQDQSHNQTFVNFQLETRKSNRQMAKYETKPTIVTAAHFGYYKPLEATVFYIHKHFPDFPLIIYDLGLTTYQLKKLMLNCKCQVRKFDQDAKYSGVSPHVLKLKTYAWKPLIVQVFPKKRVVSSNLNKLKLQKNFPGSFK